MKKTKEESAIKGRIRGAYISSLISISLVLLILGIVGLLLLNAHTLSVYVKENLLFSLIIHDNVREADIRKYQKTLDTYDFVRLTEFVSKDVAAKQLEEDLGEDFISTLGFNPLSHTINVYLNAEYANQDSIKKVNEIFLSNTEIVNEVSYQKNLVHLINENIKRISLFLMIFSAALFIISIALLNNTVRLMIYSKRFIINTMKLIGAKKSFIRKPFLLTGFTQGLISSIIAIAGLSALIHFTNQELKGLIDFIDYHTIGILFALVICIGIILSVISTYFAVNKYLRMKSSNLYY